MKRKIDQLGFTLIEMMVVVAILGILVLLVTTGMKNVRQSADGATCIANLRTLAAAHLMYAGDHNSQFIPYLKDGLAWTAAFQEENYLEEGSKAFFCPAFSGSDLRTPREVAQTTGGLGRDARGIYSHYGYNYYHIGSSLREAGLSSEQKLQSARLASLNHPSQTILLLETVQPETAQPKRGYYIAVDRPGSQNIPEIRHPNGLNVAFADGHVATLPIKPINFWEPAPLGLGRVSDEGSLWKR